MSRPPISYPSPLNASTSSQPYPPQNGLEPSPMGSSNAPRRPSGGRSSARSQDPRHTPGAQGALDSHITKLLVHTKQMLQGVDQWAQGELDENGVSDIYVRLGNEFEIIVTAFAQAGLAIDELKTIPDDLRVCLEQCLAETPSQEALSLYLPSIRTTIFQLLNGLKQKQAAYKHMINDRSRSSPSPPPPQAHTQQQHQHQQQHIHHLSASEMPLPPPLNDPSSRLSARSASSSMSAASGSPSSITSGHSVAKAPSSHALAERARAVSRPAPPDAFRPPRPSKRNVSPQPGQIPLPEQPQIVRHQLSDNPVPSPSSSHHVIETPPKPPPKPIPHPDRFSRDSFGRPVSRFSMDSEVTNGSPVRSLPSQSPVKQLQSLNEDVEPIPSPAPPPSLPTLNLPSSGFSFEDADEQAPVAVPDVPPETQRTLAALGRSDALERRASKRFSSYTFNKLPGSPNHKKSTSAVESPQRPVRRADRLPPMPPLPESLASSNLAVSAADRSKTPSPVSGLAPPNGHGQSSELSSSPDSNKTHRSNSTTSQTGSVRVVKTPEVDEVEGISTPRPGAISPPAPASPTAVSVFLQIGRQVKKATLDLPVSLSSLRLLFMERFDYDPGVDNFPDVYIRDNATGVQFELEDMDDLKEGAVLSLDIEPLDQVKQHVDLKFATMMQELKEGLKDMRTALDQSRRASTFSPPPSLLAPSPSIGRTTSKLTDPTAGISPVASSIPLPEDTSAPAAETPRKPVSANAEQVRAQMDELQSLRRDLAVMRQVHVDFLSETKEAFAKLRKENHTMRDLVKTKMGGSRALLDNSKAKLEALCNDTIQAVEEVSDVIDNAREDAFKRFVHPSRTQMKKIEADLKKAHDMIDAFANEVAAIEPTWRATWHQELSRVMDEQKLLPHQSKLTVDLKSDITDAEEMFRNVSDFVDQRTTNAAKGVRSAYRPPTPDESGGGVKNLLMEIRTKEADPNQRLRAIEAQQRAREKEKANKTDEFQDELSGFVQGKKLKKTGGTDEVERQRQRKQDQTIKRMLTGESVSSPTGSGNMLSPQVTGASIMSQSSYTSQATQGRASRASARSEDAAVKLEPKEEF